MDIPCVVAGTSKLQLLTMRRNPPAGYKYGEGSGLKMLNSSPLFTRKITRRTTGELNYLEVFSNYIEQFLRSILVYLGLTCSILDYLGLSHTISDYLGLSVTIRDYLVLFWTFWDYLGLFWTIWDYLGLFETMWDYLGLAQSISKYV